MSSEFNLLNEISQIKARVKRLEDLMQNGNVHGVPEPPKPPATRVVRDDRKPLVLQAGLASFLARK